LNHHPIRTALTTALISLITLLSPVTARAADTGADGLSTDRIKRIDHLLQTYVSQKRLPGAVYAISRKGQPAVIGNIGPYDRDTLFRMYSMTKPITAVAVLMLYEEGRFLLTDPVSRYLPEFAHPMVLGADGSQNPARNPITIDELLTHTAGLTYGDASAGGVRALYAQADLWSSHSLAAFSEKVAALPLVFEPGTRWQYSVAFDVLGRLVEVVSGQPFDRFMHDRILAPLDMRDTGFRVTDAQLDRFVDLYRRDGDGMTLSKRADDREFRDPQLVPYGGGGLVSTARDYLRFCQMLLNGGRLGDVRLLSRKTVDLMMSDHLGKGFTEPRLNEDWVSRTENRTGDLHLGFGFGFGGYVITDVAENNVPGSTGTYAWGGAASTYFFIDRREQLIGLFLTQLTPSDSYPLRAQFRGLVYQAIDD